MQVLETTRLILRRWRFDDIDDFFEYARNPNVGMNAGWRPHENKMDTMKVLVVFMQLEGMWAIEHKGLRKVIGSIGISDDIRRKMVNAKMIGYALSEAFWGNGFTTEATREIVKYSFETEGVELLTIYHYPNNYRSQRVIEKSGFRYEGILRSASRTWNGVIHDEQSYSMTRGEYFDIVMRTAKQRQAEPCDAN